MTDHGGHLQYSETKGLDMQNIQRTPINYKEKAGNLMEG